ncbi:MAG: hypothetical protein FWH00_04625 [Oscillospiraceae bacterium]|nr:hypothetical protein [Oscillospiraceae bacterium]
MAYFDSPGNRESWEHAMVGLREERARRLSGGGSREMSEMRGMAFGERKVQYSRVPVTYTELHEEEFGKQRASSRDMEKSGPVRERTAERQEPSLGKGGR